MIHISSILSAENMKNHFSNSLQSANYNEAIIIIIILYSWEIVYQYLWFYFLGQEQYPSELEDKFTL